MPGKYTQQEVLYQVRYLFTHWLASVSFLLACAVFLTVICWKSPVLLLCLLLGSIAVVVIGQIGQRVGLSRRWLILLQTLALSAILSVFWLDYFSVPAAAQFFGKAENFFKNTLTQGVQGEGSAAAVSLVFNVLRALYLLYIAVALIGVINAVRKDEDWQVVARTPLLVVIAVTIADVLTSFIIG
jgi:UDP-N-acetylmuramyl pentapeptide phosphotransferase/UDP-N-acetylglucosamine-1-phosphate transferase